MSRQLPESRNHKPAIEFTGIAGLDEILGGGVPGRRLYVVEGLPGSGKTTFALEFLREGVRLGQRVLYVTLSETLEELSDVAASHGWTLDGIDVLELDSLADRFEEQSNYTVFHPADVELSDTVGRIRAEVERLNPDRVASIRYRNSKSFLRRAHVTGAKFLGSSNSSPAASALCSCWTIAQRAATNNNCKALRMAFFGWNGKRANTALLGGRSMLSRCAACGFRMAGTIS